MGTVVPMLKTSCCASFAQRLSWLVLVSTLFVVGQLNAQLTGLQPASIDNTISLARLTIRPQDLAPADALAVRCQAFVETDGSLTELLCTSDDGMRDRRLIRQVANELEGASFSPARVDGREVRVLMNFAVLISCAGGECNFVPVPHHGYLIAEFGLDYVAPQPIVSTELWYTGFEYRGPRRHSAGLAPPGGPNGLPSGWFVAAVEVGSDGIAVASCIYALDNVYRDDIRQGNRRRLELILGELAATRYIPGFYEGVPAPMQFFEANNVVVEFIAPEGAQGFATRREAPELYCDR